MHSITVWNFAQSPNYNTNIDKEYPYSEVPYIGEYKLVKIPSSRDNIIELVDYWGEGKIDTKAGTSGFPDSYNVNHHYQLVSNGPDRERKIPNRIPVISYTNCDTSSYIKDDSVRNLTLMGAPINKSCAKDIARIINTNTGNVIVFGFDVNSPDVKNLEEELNRKQIFYCPGFILPELFRHITLFDNYRAHVNLKELKEVLINKIKTKAYDDTLDISKKLMVNNQNEMLDDVVHTLFKDKVKNVLEYTYVLWNNNAKNIVINHFPQPFKIIFNGDNLKIINTKYQLALKLASSADSTGNRLAWGDGSNTNGKTIMWKLIPLWENSTLSFKIKNVEYDIYLELDENVDKSENRRAKASKLSENTQQLWHLTPAIKDDNIIFSIVNIKYRQGLKLDPGTDWCGDRMVWGDKESSLFTDFSAWIVTEITDKV